MADPAELIARLEHIAADCAERGDDSDAAFVLDAAEWIKCAHTERRIITGNTLDRINAELAEHPDKHEFWPWRIFKDAAAALRPQAGTTQGDRDERQLLQLIDERDNAEEALSQAFYIVTGRSPEWSNLFHHNEALEEIKDAVSVLKQAARPEPTQGASADAGELLRRVESCVENWDDGHSDWHPGYVPEDQWAACIEVLRTVPSVLSAMRGTTWRDIVKDPPPKDGTEFQAWTGCWEPRCRINPETETFEIWGRVDYDQEGWDVYSHLTATHWTPLPAAPETAR